MESRRDVFQAIADPTRREIINLVATESQNLSELAEHFNVSRQAISLHVKILHECGVLSIRQEGRERYCSLQLETLGEVSNWLEPLIEMMRKRYDQLDKVLTNLNLEDHEDEPRNEFFNR